jgi:hypothetical protein
VCVGTGGTKLQLATGQYVKMNSSGTANSSSSGGYITNVIPPPFPNPGVQLYTEWEFECIVENTTLQVTSMIGVILVA